MGPGFESQRDHDIGGASNVASFFMVCVENCLSRFEPRRDEVGLGADRSVGIPAGLKDEFYAPDFQGPFFRGTELGHHNEDKSVSSPMKAALTYSQKMKQYRFEHQLKQADIAKKLGISQKAYSLIENGTQKPKIDFILLYVKVTGVDLTDALQPLATNDRPVFR